MKKTQLPFVLLFTLLCINSIIAQDTFTRSFEIPVPLTENTGFGDFVSGVDFDGDGLKEIYAVNNMLDQGGNELIPRMYKFEFNGTSWDSVWSATLTNIPAQNSWAAVTYGDWDQDGKPEIIWGPTNNLTADSQNPSRILVFEYAGDGSDDMGVDIFGNFAPNAQWSISDQDGDNIRPFRWYLHDIDLDGQIELCFGERAATMHFGIVSVSDIPDNGDGSETWTLEHSGSGLEIDAASIYDCVVFGSGLILIHSNGIVDVVNHNGSSWDAPISFPDMVPGGSWKSASVTDMNDDEIPEIVVGGWSSAEFSNFYIIEFDAFAILKSATVMDLTEYVGVGGRITGGASGDIDQDGKMDYVFTTRQATPNGAVVRIEYQGGPLTSSDSYSYSVIDSLLSETGSQRFDIVDISNVDDDPELEVIYGDGNQTGRIPLAVLDISVAVSVDDETVPNSYFLGQNYPNPFNPATTIRFGLPRESVVDLRIFDILGREIAVLIDNELKSPGSYDVEFNAGSLSSGTYIYRLKTNGFVETRKMTLIK